MDSNRSMKIGFTGDLSFSGYFADANGNPELFDKDILEFFHENHFNVINFESPITPCRITGKKRLAHRSNPEDLDFLKTKVPGLALSLANNHMMDYGRIGLIDTLESVEERQIPYVGAGRCLEEASSGVVLSGPFKIGIVAHQYKKLRAAGKRFGGPVHESAKAALRNQIERYKRECDFVVMVYHGGDEFLHQPLPAHRRQMKRYLKWGCDAVVGHHPHVVQGYEQVGSKLIYYSLGNFMFDTDYQRSQLDTDRGVLLRLIFSDTGISHSIQPIRINRDLGRVESEPEDPHFLDLRKIQYAREWHLEALRRQDVLARAAELKNIEQMSRIAEKEDEGIVVEQLRMAAVIKKAMEESKAEDENDDDDDDAQEMGVNGDGNQETAEQMEQPGFVKRKSAYQMARMLYRKFWGNNKNNIRSIQYKYGKAMARMGNKIRQK